MGYNDIENANYEMTYGSLEYLDGYRQLFSTLNGGNTEPEEPIPDDYYAEAIEKIRKEEDDYEKILSDIRKVREECEFMPLPEYSDDGDFLDIDLITEMEKAIRKAADEISEKFFEIKDHMHNIRAKYQDGYNDDRCADILRRYGDIAESLYHMRKNLGGVEQAVMETGVILYNIKERQYS